MVCFVRHSLQGYRFELYLFQAIRTWFCCGFQYRNTECKWAIPQAHPSFFLWQMPSTSTEGDVHFPHTFSSNKGHRHNCFWEVLNGEHLGNHFRLLTLITKQGTAIPQLQHSWKKAEESSRGALRVPSLCTGHHEVCASEPVPIRDPCMGGINRMSLKQVANKDTKDYLGKNRKEGLMTKWEVRITALHQFIRFFGSSLLSKRILTKAPLQGGI